MLLIECFCTLPGPHLKINIYIYIKTEQNEMKTSTEGRPVHTVVCSHGRQRFHSVFKLQKLSSRPYQLTEQTANF